MGQYRKTAFGIRRRQKYRFYERDDSNDFIDKCIVRLFIIAVGVANEVYFWTDPVVDKLHAKEDAFNEEDQKFSQKNSCA